MLALFKSIWEVVISVITFLIDATKDFFEWMKKPGSKLKFLCGLLTLFLVIVLLIVFSKQQEINRLNTLVSTNIEKHKLATSKLDANIRGKDLALIEITAKLKIEEEKLNAFRDTAAQESKTLQNKLANLQIQEKTWASRYNQRPTECRAALELLDTACPTMEDY